MTVSDVVSPSPKGGGGGAGSPPPSSKSAMDKNNIAGVMCGMFALVFCYMLMKFCSWLRLYPPRNSYCI